MIINLNLVFSLSYNQLIYMFRISYIIINILLWREDVRRMSINHSVSNRKCSVHKIKLVSACEASQFTLENRWTHGPTM